MDEQLRVLAEIAVGLAGFSSIVVVFRRRDAGGTWKPEDAFRFRIMLESSLFAALFAIAPAALAALNVPPGVLWPTASAALLVYLASETIQRPRAIRRLPAGALNPRLVGSIVGLHLAAAVLQVLNVVGWGVSPGPGPYLAGVTWLTTYAGLMFYRLVTARIREPGIEPS